MKQHSMAERTGYWIIVGLGLRDSSSTYYLINWVNLEFLPLSSQNNIGPGGNIKQSCLSPVFLPPLESNNILCRQKQSDADFICGAVTPSRVEVVTGADVWLGRVDRMMVEKDQNNSSCPPPNEKEMMKYLWLGPFLPAPGKSFAPKYLYSQSWFYLFLRCQLLCSLSTVTDTTRLKTLCDLWCP